MEDIFQQLQIVNGEDKMLRRRVYFLYSIVILVEIIALIFSEKLLSLLIYCIIFKNKNMNISFPHPFILFLFIIFKVTCIKLV